ncbi:MAG TPA: sugar ABC transporter permease [Firmicutes bacterium]|nr:sugar ABC transporter permease [Candidatus Fermentithermobacillaceae bacterium]
MTDSGRCKQAQGDTAIIREGPGREDLRDRGVDKEPTRRKAVLRGKTRLRTFEVVGLWLTRVILWVAVLASLFPTAWVVTASFQKGDAFFSNTLIPKQFTVENYAKVIRETDFLRWVKNSLILCTGSALIQVFLTATAAYGFSRFRFRGRKYGLMTLLLLQMFPASMALVAIYTMLARLNLLDNLYAFMFVMAGGSAFNIWITKGYMDSLPKELDEAAMVDGATHWQVFRYVILPLARPMLIVVFLWSFMGTYSEFMLSSAVLKNPHNYTIALGLQRFILNQFAARWTLFSAASLMASLPVVIIWMFLQKYVVSGLTRGAVKG